MCCELGFMQLSHTFGGNEQGTGEQGERPGGSGAGQIQRARHATATADGDVATDGRTDGRPSRSTNVHQPRALSSVNGGT